MPISAFLCRAIFGSHPNNVSLMKGAFIIPHPKLSLGALSPVLENTFLFDALRVAEERSTAILTTPETACPHIQPFPAGLRDKGVFGVSETTQRLPEPTHSDISKQI